MGRVRKKRIKTKYGKSKGTIPRPIVFSETKRGGEAAARRRRRRAAAPKGPTEPREPKETIEPLTAVNSKEPVPAIYEPENIAAEIQSITDETTENLEKELATDEPLEYGMLKLGVEEITRYRKRIIPIDKMSGLYDHILELVKANKDGITPTDILSDCGRAYGMPIRGKSNKKWAILDEIASVEKDGKITFRDGKYFPC